MVVIGVFSHRTCPAMIHHRLVGHGIVGLDLDGVVAGGRSILSKDLVGTGLRLIFHATFETVTSLEVKQVFGFSKWKLGKQMADIKR